MIKRTLSKRLGKTEMSGTSRPALLRVVEIHKVVRAGQCPGGSTLAKAIEVTPKTIQRDVSFMRDQLGMPLE